MEGAAGHSAGHRDGGRMADAVKQGFLYLQQQQTFGKVGGARPACEEFPGRTGVRRTSPSPCGMAETVLSTK